MAGLEIMDKSSVLIETYVNPTESEEKVKTAISNIFGNVTTKVEITPTGTALAANILGVEKLDNFRNLLRRDRVRNAAKRVFYAGSKEKTVSFCLNKQVAYAGHVSFSQEAGESPLGPIKVTIKCENPREVVAWLTT